MYFKTQRFDKKIGLTQHIISSADHKFWRLPIVIL